MLTLRRAAERGHVSHGWLDTWHTFSFGDYRDPRHVRFRALRVINEDRIAPGQGFGAHPHHDMEILTYVLSGALEHRDSLGHGQILRAGELQRMTAGSGIWHSEFNPSPTETVHLYQIWIFPRDRGLAPSYEQRAFPAADRSNRWQLVAAPAENGDAFVIQADARLYLADLAGGQELHHHFSSNRHGWLQVLRGTLTLDQFDLTEGDGVAISDEPELRLVARHDSQLLLFDLA